MAHTTTHTAASPCADLLEAMQLIGRLKREPRTGWMLQGIGYAARRGEASGVHDVAAPDGHVQRTWIKEEHAATGAVESVAEHMYRMAMLSWMLAGEVSRGEGTKEGDELDAERCIKMALVHDAAEAIVGDITPFSGITKDAKHALEEEAMEKMCTCVHGSNTCMEMLRQAREWMALFNEYNSNDTTEARAVKDLDKFEMMLQAMEYERQYDVDLECFFESTRNKIQHPIIRRWEAALREQYMTERAARRKSTAAAVVVDGSEWWDGSAGRAKRLDLHDAHDMTDVGTSDTACVLCKRRGKLSAQCTHCSVRLCVESAPDAFQRYSTHSSATCFFLFHRLIQLNSRDSASQT